MKYEPTNLEIAQIFLRVLCDKKPEKVDALCVHAAIGNERIDYLLAKKAASIWNSGTCGVVVINGLDVATCARDNHACSGYEKFISKLLEFQVPRERIILMSPSANTAEESKNFLLLVKENNWHSIMIESMPYHLARCLLTIVALMKELDIHTKVYTTTFDNVDWDMQVQRNVLGGQNILGQKDENGSFIDLMKNELERIERYAIPGEGYTQTATISEALEYLQKRDNQI